MKYSLGGAITGTVSTVEVSPVVFSCCQAGKGFIVANTSYVPYTDSDGNNITIAAKPTDCEITFSSPITFTGETFISLITYIKEKAIGAWDNYNKNYVLSMQGTPSYLYPTTDYDTVIFDESSLGWTRFP